MFQIFKIFFCIDYVSDTALAIWWRTMSFPSQVIVLDTIKKQIYLLLVNIPGPNLSNTICELFVGFSAKKLPRKPYVIIGQV